MVDVERWQYLFAAVNLKVGGESIYGNLLFHPAVEVVAGPGMSGRTEVQGGYGGARPPKERWMMSNEVQSDNRYIAGGTAAEGTFAIDRR